MPIHFHQRGNRISNCPQVALSLHRLLRKLLFYRGIILQESLRFGQFTFSPQPRKPSKALIDRKRDLLFAANHHLKIIKINLTTAFFIGRIRLLFRKRSDTKG